MSGVVPDTNGGCWWQMLSNYRFGPEGSDPISGALALFLAHQSRLHGAGLEALQAVHSCLARQPIGAEQRARGKKGFFFTGFCAQDTTDNVLSAHLAIFIGCLCHRSPVGAQPAGRDEKWTGGGQCVIPSTPFLLASVTRTISSCCSEPLVAGWPIWFSTSKSFSSTSMQPR